MPRNPAAKKHQHNNRHDSGLVGPGKRVTRQKSNGHLNGTPKGPVPSEPVPQVPSTDPSVSAPSHSQSDTATLDSSREIAKELTQSSKGGESEGNEGKEKDNKTESNGSAVFQQRRGEMSSSKPKAPQELSALQIASTIIRSRPACDTVSLLIVLLALPSMILTIVQALFASLTLMPGGGAPVSFLSLLDIFQGSAGAPSITTMVVVDVICFGLWVCLWTWAQNFALDLAQIQIAITLGNGSSGKNGRANVICVIGVLLLHLIRSRGVRRFLFTNLVPMELLSQAGLTEYFKYLPSDSDFGESPGPPSHIRSLFAIHIISQAVMAFVRRRVSSSQSSSSTKSKRADTEASAGSASDMSALESASAGVSSAIDYQAPPTPGLKEGKEKGVSAKKRRRQANHVRNRQPFWAALASTKVHVLREVEHNKALPPLANNQGTPFETVQRDIVWITNVEPSSISFEAAYASSSEHDPPVTSDYRPFYVRINGARWHSVSLEAMEPTSVSEGNPAQWSGTISGLAPNCTYTCTFIRTDGEEEFASVMVKTPVLLDKDLPLSLAPIPVRQSMRPSSPTTTLKNSISTAEAKLNEARNRLTKLRRQHRTALAKVEKEVDSFNTRLKTASDDTKQRQKLLQAERSIRQTEDATLEIDAALEGLVSTPDDEIEEHNACKAAYEEQSKRLADANEALSKARSAASNDLSCANSELNNIVSRKERLTSRNTKLTEQHDRITHANVQGLNEKERRAAESNAKSADQQRREAELTHQIRFMENELRNSRMRWEANLRELDLLEKQELAQREMMLTNSGPLTPEGELPGTRPPPQPARPYAFGSFQAFPNSPVTEVQGSPFLAYAKTLPSNDQQRPRSDTNRSAGGVSNFSGEFEDADPIPPMPSTTEYEATGRKGSGSTGSRGKNNGSPAAAMIGSAMRSPQRGSYSPGHIPGSTTW
ncbi:Ubiquitination network signaling protein acrB [Exophiala dermatitidis]